MKKFLIFLISLILILNSSIFICFADFSKSFETDANIVYMTSLDEHSGIIYDKNSQVKCNPGELVKLVTGILVLENCDDLNTSVTASSNAIRSIESLRVTTAGILVGETMTVEELLYCMLVYNANDAAVVLAEFIGGTQENFVEMMNGFAERLNLSNTLFSNPGGFNVGEQYSTARDISEIFKYCINNSVLETILSTFLYEMPATNKYKDTRYLKNTNYLINYTIPDYYLQTVKFGKSGYTENLNCNCVSFASQDGYTYLCVVMDAPMKDFDNDDTDENMSFIVSKQLYKWAFENIRLRVVANTSTYVGEVKVRLSNEFDYVSLVPAENVSALVPAGVNAESVLIEPISEITLEKTDAPVKKGDVLGRAAVKYAGSTVAEVDLVAAFDVKVSSAKYFGDKILNVIKHPVFIIIAVILILLVLPLTVYSYRNKQKRLRMQKIKEREKRKEKREEKNG